MRTQTGLDIPADLIDRLALCDLLKRYEWGVRTTIRQVGNIAIDHNVAMLSG